MFGKGKTYSPFAGLMVIYIALGILAHLLKMVSSNLNTSRFVSVIVHLFIILCRSVSQDPIRLAHKGYTKSPSTKSPGHYITTPNHPRQMQVNNPLSATFEALMKFLLPMSRPWGAQERSLKDLFIIVICFEQLTAKKGGKQMRTKDHHCKYDQVNINCTNNLFATKKCEDINQQIWEGTRWAPY